MVRLPIVLADGHEIVRFGVKHILAASSAVEVVGEARDGPGAIIACETFRPAILVTELTLARLAGAQVIARLMAQHRHLRVLVLTARDDEGSVSSAFGAGAVGYVLKQSPPSALVDALDALGRGDPYIDPHLPTDYRIKTLTTSPMELTAREQHVLALVAIGYSNKEIAAMTSVSVKTVETDRARATEKLGLSTKPALVRYALDQGWLDDLISDV
jgi:DNA-binding NarL/FixJ family response regulator